MRFVFRGYFEKGRRKIKFTKEIEDENEKLAREKLYSILGSNHKVKRVKIHVEEVKRVEA
jgi:large subunit ribosomal protein LX